MTNSIQVCVCGINSAVSHSCYSTCLARLQRGFRALRPTNRNKSTQQYIAVSSSWVIDSRAGINDRRTLGIVALGLACVTHSAQLLLLGDMKQFMYRVAKKQIKDQQLRVSHSDTVQDSL